MWKEVATIVLGARSAARLPERVREAIARQQLESEILIGWAQLVLVVIFGALYAVAPKTATTAGFHPVPWALASYFLFTTARLLLAHRSWLPDWMLILSVVVDIGLLMLLIWSFHIQYMQPATFYLKAPTLLYVFIFIALRALRFEAKYVLVAGLAAALGWTFLLWYAIAGEMNPLNMVTRDYVLYITSNRILIGAEIDKIVSIILVTLVLAVAVTRAQRTLHRSVLEGTVARDLSKFVSPEIANRIASADKAIQAGDGELRIATVMFTDIEGFSTLSEKLSPQALAKTLNEYFGALCDVVERHGGVVTMFQGDAMLIAYNTVKPDPNHAVSALRTALDIQDVVNSRTFGDGVTLKTRCGVNTGEIVTGAVGAKDRLVFTVHGDEVNVAARLEQLNKQYGTYVLCTGRTKAEAGGLFTYERIGEVTVRGRAAPTEVYAVR
jgi:adenylate cyclase